MVDVQNENKINSKLDIILKAFSKSLYQEDEVFMENMKKNAMVKDDLSKYRFWEWPQGVGLFGMWKMFEMTGDTRYYAIIVNYYDEQIHNGLPSKNINTCAPMLALSYLFEQTKDETYGAVCDEWAEWIMKDLVRTREGGFQHITSDTENKGELWDDTLFMTVLFLANIGRIRGCREYIREAEYQFLLHTKYLADRKTGLWYHGWTFEGNHNFAEAFWGRGNCWVTASIPLFLEMVDVSDSVRSFLVNTLERQVAALYQYQSEEGMWHTLIDDPTSYLEASGTCGFAFGMLKAADMGIIDGSYRECALKALEPILDCIDEEGVVGRVSYGTPMGRENKQFYKDIPIQPMPYGPSLAMLFLMEAKRFLGTAII